MPLIRRSCGPDYQTKYKWPCSAQCGGCEKYGWFFEAFPDQGMIRTDSKESIEDCEEKAWKKFLLANNCPYDHKDPANLDRRDYKNGCSFCKHCGTYLDPSYSGLLPTTTCTTCGVPTYWSYDKFDNWYCQEHFQQLPDEMLSEFQLERRHRKDIMEKDIDPEQFKQALTDIVNHILHNDGKEKKGREEGTQHAES